MAALGSVIGGGVMFINDSKLIEELYDDNEGLQADLEDTEQDMFDAGMAEAAEEDGPSMEDLERGKDKPK